ncbi:keratin, type I cytoskeletal 18 isoform X4 [Scophthalmus maximus]|nr:keratin, type I cytoskeletal 18 isoform X4 [Scophthalmus maximus]
MQVQCLEAANQRLRLQIQEQLDTKFHDELRTVSLLQHQVGECLSARAQVKLQLLGAELSVFHFSSRCEKVREHCRRLEAEIRDLRRRGEELRFHQLPRLQRLLNHGTEQQVELKIQHQQDVQGLLAQVSGEVAVGMQTDPSSDLIRQLDDLRQTSALLLDRNRDGRSSDPQVSVLTSLKTTLDPGEVIRAELAELRRMAAGLQDELTQLQNLTALLEDLCPEQTESLVLQQRADGLCRDLESVRQVAAQQADAQQALLDINNKLEAELRDYKRLLDGLSQER